ncbi:MAG: PEGA domain-containing protein [Candidatus Euphemobacter frigidus]|nr:PEGA domain-containing protein [Candidatus Euphemobacter frigidus]MDP8274774.1 PEGA domain-containing protein [Candidatus Euphemobacter frigidus]
MKNILTIILIFAVFCQGCATVFKGSKSSVNFNSEPEGAKVMIGGMNRGTTPLVLELPSGKNQLVEFQKIGYLPQQIFLKGETMTGYVILDIVPGFLLLWVPILVDAVTGNWNSLEPDNVLLTLEPAAAPR